MEVSKSQGSGEQNQPRDTYKIAYLIFFLLGAGNLVPWNSFITAVDYFEYLYPNQHIDKVFSVAYMGSSLLILLLLMCWSSSRRKLPGFKLRMNVGQTLFVLALMTAPVTGWIARADQQQRQVKTPITYAVLILAMVVCGLADGLAAGSLIGSAGELPGRYMQAVFAGNASSGILVCILRIITKASLPHSPKGLQMSTQIYFIISTFIIFVCIVCSNVLDKLPVIQHYQKQRTVTSKTPLPALQNGTKTSLGRSCNAVEPNEQQPKLWDVVWKIRWPAIGVFMIYIVTLSVFPGYLTENVKSQFFRDWYPILLITTYDLMDFLGKSLTAIYVPKKITGATWACFIRLLLYPLFVVCLHGPKSLRGEFPVVFLTAMLGFTNGYLTSVLMMLAPKLVPMEEAETVGIVMVLFLVIGLAAGSVLGWLWNI